VRALAAKANIGCSKKNQSGDASPHSKKVFDTATSALFFLSEQDPVLISGLFHCNSTSKVVDLFFEPLS
jgi:hypothetical protein